MNRTILACLTTCFLSLLALLFGCSDGAPIERIERDTVVIYEPAPDAGESDADAMNDSEILWDRREPAPPPGKQGWQQSADLVTGDPVKQGSMQANFPRAGYYTVQFGVQQPVAVGGNTAWRTLADVSWSVEGSTVRRTISVGNGVSISGPGQAVAVTVRDDSDATISTFGIPYKVFMQVTPGTRPSEEQPPTLVAYAQQQTVAALSFLDTPVPTDAGAISVEVSLGTNKGAAPPQKDVVQQMTPGFATIKAYDPNLVPGFVPLAPGATIVRYFNNTATPQTVQVTFGIDG